MVRELLKTEEVAEMTGLSEASVRQKVYSGAFKAKKTGRAKQSHLRILRSSVLEWIESLPDAVSVGSP